MIPSVGPGLTSCSQVLHSPTFTSAVPGKRPGIVGWASLLLPPTPGLAWRWLSLRPMLHRPPAAPWCPRFRKTALHFKASPPPEAAWDPCAGWQHSGSSVQGTPEPHKPGFQPTQTSRLSLAYQRPPAAGCMLCPEALQLGIPRCCLLCFLSFKEEKEEEIPQNNISS